MKKRVLITGGQGILGQELYNILSSNCICLVTDRNDMDILDENLVTETFQDFSPQVVIHCAAYTAVDKAESERNICYQINVEGTRNIAKACNFFACELVFISTDYVFSGEGTNPLEVDDPKKPVNYYGETKLLAEQIVSQYCTKFYIVRTSWLFASHGKSFIAAMMSKQHQKEINVVDDQIGSPTYAPFLAEMLSALIKTGKYGVYHATCEGFCSWAEFAEEIFRSIGRSDIQINRIKSSQYDSLAERPLNSRLSKHSLDTANIPRLPHWRQGILAYLDNINHKF